MSVCGVLLCLAWPLGPAKYTPSFMGVSIWGFGMPPLTEASKLLAFILLTAGDIAARGGSFDGKTLAAVELFFGA